MKISMHNTTNRRTLTRNADYCVSKRNIGKTLRTNIRPNFLATDTPLRKKKIEEGHVNIVA